MASCAAPSIAAVQADLTAFAMAPRADLVVLTMDRSADAVVPALTRPAARRQTTNRPHCRLTMRPRTIESGT